MIRHDSLARRSVPRLSIPPIPDSPSLAAPTRDSHKTTGRDPNSDANAREHLPQLQLRSPLQYEPVRVPKLERSLKLHLERGVIPGLPPKHQTRKITHEAPDIRAIPTPKDETTRAVQRRERQ